MIAVLAIVAGISLPYAGNLVGGNRPEVAARDIATALRRTRNLAIAQNLDRALVVDVELKRLRVDGEAPRQLPAGLRYALLVAQIERLDSSTGGIRFHPDGSSTGGEISVGNGRTAFRVEVEWLTGRVVVVRADGA